MKRKEMKIMNLNPITMQLVADKYIRLALEEDIHSEDVSHKRSDAGIQGPEKWN